VTRLSLHVTSWSPVPDGPSHQWKGLSFLSFTSVTSSTDPCVPTVQHLHALGGRLGDTQKNSWKPVMTLVTGDSLWERVLPIARVPKGSSCRLWRCEPRP
jgi:hypothetical protein